MDVAYDHTFEEPVVNQKSEKGKEPEAPQESLSDEFQQAYKAISASPWGARFGTFLGTVKERGEAAYETSSKEFSTVAEQATKGFSDIRKTVVERTRALSLSTADGPPPLPNIDGSVAGQPQEEGLLSKLRKGAAQKISEMEAAEARADEYLAKFGNTVGNFLKEAVTIAPPAEEEVGKDGEVLFENKDGKRQQIYTTRLDQQLHLLHNKHELFKVDPSTDSESFATFVKTFSVDKETESIAANLERYPELRETMEKLVPGEVKYDAFWTRYYFLRNELDLEEQRRKELLKGAAAANEEEVAWDEDDENSDSDDDSSDGNTTDKAKPVKASTETLLPKKDEVPAQPKTSTDRASQPDSEESYDLVSGAASKANSPPKPQAPIAKKKKAEESSDDDSDDESEEDWE